MSEEASRESEQRFRRIYESGLLGVIFWNMDGAITDANDKFLEMVGYSRDDLRAGRIDWPAMTPPEFRSLDEAAVVELKASGVNEPFEKEYFCKDGSRIPILIAGAMIDDARDHGAAFVLDMTQRKRTEAALRESRARLEGIVGSAMDAIITIDASQRIVLFNAAAEKMFRCPRAEALGGALDRFIPARFRQAHAQKVRGFGETGTTTRAMGTLGALSAVRTNGEEFPIEASISQVEVDGHKLFTVILRDVTERARAEAAVAIRARQQSAVADLSQHALTGRDLDRLTNDAVALVAQVLEIEFAKVLKLTPAGDALILQAGVGWRDGCVGVRSEPTGRESQAGFTLLSSAPVVMEDLAQETRFRPPELLAEHGVVSGVSAIIHGKTKPFGVLGAHTTSRRPFSSDDVHFVQSIADVLAAAIERRQLEEELLAATGREQRRLGQDLHDGLCQHLAGIEFRNEALARDLEDDPAAREEVEKIGALLREGTRQARMLARGLAPVELEKNGLMSALAELATNSAHLYRIACQFVCEQPVLVTNDATATHLYRIAQEAISNAVRHASAKSIAITLRPVDEEAVMTIANDGAALPAEPGRDGGMGLRIMRYRAELIGAILRLGSTGEGKTELSCTFKPHG
jgi:PAS domain S-box-containing protein